MMLLTYGILFQANGFSFRINNPEDITFHLLHLSLLREYIDWEFEPLKVWLNFKLFLSMKSFIMDLLSHHFGLIVVNTSIIIFFLFLQEKITFGYDLEKIIDDWILMGFLVGNDFIPNLPNLHINHVMLNLLYIIKSTSQKKSC